MIKIIDDWYITVETSPVCYTVRRGKGKKDKKGAWADKPKGFYGNLQSAVKAIRGYIAAEELTNASPTLSDAIRTISDVDARFEEIIKRIGA